MLPFHCQFPKHERSPPKGVKGGSCLNRDSDVRRTTVILRPEDQQNLVRVREMQGGVSDVEAIRRSLSLVRELLEWTKLEGGDIILQKGRRKERIRLL
jgi:hypothetical protein